MVISCNFNELHISGQDQQIPIYFNIDNNPLLRQCMFKECGHSKKQLPSPTSCFSSFACTFTSMSGSICTWAQVRFHILPAKTFNIFRLLPYILFLQMKMCEQFHNCYRFNINVTCIWHISCQAGVLSSYPARKSVEALADSSLTREPYHQNCQWFAPLHRVVSSVPTASICSWNHVAPWTCDFWKRDLEKNHGASGRWTKFTMCLNMSLYLMNTTELFVLVLVTSFIRTYTPPWNLPIHHDIYPMPQALGTFSNITHLGCHGCATVLTSYQFRNTWHLWRSYTCTWLLALPVIIPISYPISELYRNPHRHTHL